LALEELIRSCANGNNAPAWEEFVCLFQPVIASTIIKAVRSSATYSPERIDDLIQETYLRIWATGTLNKFRSAEPKSIFGLVQAVAYSVALDDCRREGAIKRGGRIRFLPLDMVGPLSDAGDSVATECNLLFGEIESILAEIAPFPRDRMVFLLHYRHGMSAKDIAGLSTITLGKKGVESLINRILHELRRRVLLSVAQQKHARGEGKLAFREGNQTVNSS
jgi:DNA-directed RNA polymerase specialized sigma24 family protein